MGFMDNFTSDSPVTVKQPDYYAMVKEAAKAELITNAVNAEVPGYYIQAMITGKKPDFLNTLDTEEEETGFRTEYEQITGAVVSIFEAWEKENGVALLIFTAVAIKILEGDATIAFITVPLGLSMLLSKEMLIINKYYWKCEEKAERGVQ